MAVGRDVRDGGGSGALPGKDGSGNNGGSCSHLGIANVGHVGDGRFGSDVGVLGFNKGSDFGVTVEYGTRTDVGERANPHPLTDDRKGDLGTGDGGFLTNLGVGDGNVRANRGPSSNGGSPVEEYPGI